MEWWSRRVVPVPNSIREEQGGKGTELMPEESYLRKQAWDYFQLHASQRMTIFNFYLISSSLIATSYFASFKVDSNLQGARPLLSVLLCVIAFVFWKLDQRTKFLIKNAENALRYFEGLDAADKTTKVFTNEEEHRTVRRARGWRRVFHLSYSLSYSECFNSVFLTFFLLGVGSLLFHFKIWATLRRMVH
jgi:hypothetical protein